jgi:hypothetical protein
MYFVYVCTNVCMYSMYVQYVRMHVCTTAYVCIEYHIDYLYMYVFNLDLCIHKHNVSHMFDLFHQSAT